MKKIFALLFITANLFASTVAQCEPTVARHAFATEVTAREPSGVAETFPPEVEMVFFFTQIVGIEGKSKVEHVWNYSGVEMVRVPLAVEGPSWRTWSSKKIMAHQQGEWTVQVVHPESGVIGSGTFTVE